ncbi:hypothetical protein L2E82_15519 [Cichorium intybus]|uniref:Uncharacterized protein n=1 Tax=Cichorium intybus TaxID=13427 RepID=A0ACB9F320_CICIN|nr:hypothetical protein L2E82_15519 [Cichorium intybus]
MSRRTPLHVIQPTSGEAALSMATVPITFQLWQKKKTIRTTLKRVTTSRDSRRTGHGLKVGTKCRAGHLARALLSQESVHYSFVEFERRAFFRIFHMNESVYRDLILEFLAMLAVDGLPFRRHDEPYST